MLRPATLLLVIATSLGGCVSTAQQTAQTPAPSTTPGKQTEIATEPPPDIVLLRKRIAQKIVSTHALGRDWLRGQWHLMDARFYGPFPQRRWLDGKQQYVYCAGWVVKDFINQPKSLRFIVTPGPSGKMSALFESGPYIHCTGPSEPYPELEALSAAKLAASQ